MNGTHLRTHLYMLALLGASLCSPATAHTNTLPSTLAQLQEHVSGDGRLSAAQLKQAATHIEKDLPALSSDESTLQAALQVVQSYESQHGPLFLNKPTQRGLPRKPAGGLELERTILTLQQALIDHAYTPQNVKDFQRTFDGAKFETSTYFPGAVSPPEDSNVIHEVQINASQPTVWGSPVMGHADHARRPTGSYVAPGSIVIVRVPPALVDQGYNIRVGAHSWDLKKKPVIKRMDRVSIVYPITNKDTWITSPLGGGIYIEVPYEADAGIVQVLIKNAVRAPYFSARSFAPTSLAEWQRTERQHPAPWADFESDKFMMQVPTNWIYAFDDPLTLMQDWDKAMDAVSELFGLPLVQPKTVLYLQTDVVMRGQANFPGYPQSNYAYNPQKDEKGHSKHWILKGPQYADWTVLHEVGHAMAFTKFRGETEAAVNLPHVAAMNTKFGMELDRAFGDSVAGKKQISLEQAAIMWMVTENFRQGKPMNHSNKPGDEMKYQHRGYAKYVEIAHLFGWEALSRFWHSVHEDYMQGITYPRNTDPTDSRILRMSIAAGADLTPLIHFWGIPPESPRELAQAMRKEGLRPSLAIRDRLLHYKTLIPMDNAAFKKHTKIIYPKGLGKPKNLLYGEGWYSVWQSKYNASHGEAAQASLQAIIDLYYP